MKVSDRGVSEVLIKMHKQLEIAEGVRNDIRLPLQTSTNIAKCKADIETLLSILIFEE